MLRRDPQHQGASEWKNLDIVATISDIVDELRPCLSSGSRRNLITFVKDRPGHDRRYTINATKLRMSFTGSQKSVLRAK